MCGISGLIGKPKHPSTSFQLATKLLEKSEIRGNDASGYWATEPGDSGRVLYHKEPTKPTKFINKEAWSSLKSYNVNLLIMHARQSSQGMGDASTNKNNHPFVSNDRSIGLVHNGRIFEYSTLKKRYDLKSDCDSEILLRVYETAVMNAVKTSDEIPGLDAKVGQRMLGIKEIFSFVSNGAMAVAIGEHLGNDERHLWLFHNKERPLWVIDAREPLGQVFFVSTPEIWREAVRESPLARSALAAKKHKILEVPDNEIWYFRVDDKTSIVDKSCYMKYSVKSNNSFSSWDDKGEKLPLLPASNKVEVVSRLGDNDELTIEEPSAISIINTGYPHHRRRRQKKKNKQQRVADWETEFGDDTSKKALWRSSQGRYQESENDRSDKSDECENNLQDSNKNGTEPDLVELEPLIVGETASAEDQIARRLKMVTQKVRNGDLNSEYPIEEFEKTCKDLHDIVTEIEKRGIERVKEKSITTTEFGNTTEALGYTLKDLVSTLRIMDSN